MGTGFTQRGIFGFSSDSGGLQAPRVAACLLGPAICVDAMIRRTRLILGLTFGAVAVAAVGGLVMARQVAEPAFTVVSRHERFEIRLYASYVVAETRVAGEYWPSLNEGFRRLAGYIFGGNRSQAKIAMTAPVSAQPGSEKLPMTAPVSAQAEAGSWVVTFAMPEGSQLETLPLPNDQRVTLRLLPARRVAALRFRGWARAAQVEKKTAELLAALSGAGLVPRGTPIIAQYNPPWTLPFLRRNEILVEVAD